MKPKDDIWKMYSEPFSSNESKSKHCTCLACNSAVIAAAGRLRDHWAKCKKRPRAIGQLDAGFQPSRKSVKSEHSSNDAASTSVARSSVGGRVVDTFIAGGGRQYQYFDSMSGEELANLQQLFARAVHRTSTPFAAFEHESWRAFFKALRGSFKIPSTEAIGGDLMQHLGTDNGEIVVEEEPLDVDEEAAASAIIEEFDNVHISAGPDRIDDDDIFEEEMVDQGNIFY